MRRGELVGHERERLGGWMPATTSSPCASTRNSPKGTASPVDGLRVKATPVPERSPLLPNTICTMFTAVPRSSGMSCARRYTCARGVSHDSKTAHDGADQLRARVLGKRDADVLLVDLLRKVSTRLARSSAVRSTSWLTPRSAFSPRAPARTVRIDPVDGLSVHLDQAPVRIIREPRVSRLALAGAPPHRRARR